jgi:hypothetical protein
MATEKQIATGAAVLVGAGALVWLWRRSGGTFRAELVKRAAEDLGIQETSKNDGPEVRQYLANVNQPPGQNWCAGAVWTWIRDASERSGSPRVLEVIPPTGSAKAVADGPKRVGWWVPVETVRASSERPPPGSVPIWDRSVPPGSSWEGHIGVLESWDGDTFKSIEGNSGATWDRVARMERALADPRLLGFVVFPEKP